MHDPLPHQVRSGLRILQIIVLALAGGVVLFGIMAFVGGQQRPAGAAGSTPPPIDLIRLIGAGLLIIGAIFGAVFKALTIRSFARTMPASEAEPAALFSRYFVATILGCALLEGPALLLMINHLIGGNVFDLALAAGGVGLMVALYYPTEWRLRNVLAAVREARMRQTSGRA